MSTLVTGFGPFGEVEDNPSGHLARTSRRRFEILPVTFAAVDEFVARFEADRLLMIGVAKGRTSVTPELLARNENGPTLDVSGEGRPGEILVGGPAGLPQTFWTPSHLTRLLLDPGVNPSSNAGGYLCNYLFYAVRTRRPEVAAAFLHVPLFDVIPFERQREIVQLALRRR